MCLEEECSGGDYSRGLCERHYGKHYRNGTLESIAKPVRKRHTLSDKDLDLLTATCAICGPVKIVYKKHRSRYYCNNSKSVLTYGQFVYAKGDRLTYDQVVAARARLIEEQGDLCSICKKSSTQALSLDHCHETGKIRGLLCTKCNLGLGLFDDNIEKLKAAIEYLSLG